MLDANQFPFCSEFYEIAKTIEVVVYKGEKSSSIRIEALLNHKTGRFQTRLYWSRTVKLIPEYGDGKPVASDLWIYNHTPWTDRDSADGAIGQALSFLRERYDAPTEDDNPDIAGDPDLDSV